MISVGRTYMYKCHMSNVKWQMLNVIWSIQFGVINGFRKWVADGRTDGLKSLSCVRPCSTGTRWLSALVTFLLRRQIVSMWPQGQPLWFLDAFSHLYKRVCPSISPSVVASIVVSIAWLSKHRFLVFVCFKWLIGFKEGWKMLLGCIVRSMGLVIPWNSNIYDDNKQIRLELT